MVKNETQTKLNSKRENSISSLLLLLLTAMYTVAYNETLRAISILWYGISALTILVLLCKIIFEKTSSRISFFTWWSLIFLGYCALSSIWALKVNPIFETMKTLVLVFAAHILLAESISAKQDIEKILWANFFALLFTALFIILTIDISTLGQDRIGRDGLGELWNANDIGLKMTIGLIIGGYFFLSMKGAGKRLFLLACIALFMAIALLTGSRKVVLLIAMTIVLVLFLKAKKHRFLALVIGAVFALILYYIIMNVEIFYNVLGKRLEDMIDGLFKGGTKEGSFNERAQMISMGLNWFTERPLLGYGLSNFRILYGQAMGWETYSHNNFVEILVSGGLLGFVIYYSVYVYLLLCFSTTMYPSQSLYSFVR